jgi:hypothetical protein
MSLFSCTSLKSTTSVDQQLNQRILLICVQRGHKTVVLIVEARMIGNRDWPLPLLHWKGSIDTRT